MDKELLRKIYLNKRDTFSEQELSNLSQRLTDVLFNKILKKQSKSVFIFIPILEKNEFDTFPLIKKLWEVGIQVSVPFSNFGSSEMEPAVFNSETILVKKKYGILEPNSPDFISPKTLDLAIVPLLISDKENNRVGYGGGFYDRFLGNHEHIYKLGVSFFEPIEKIQDLDKNDVQLDEVVF